MSTTPSQELLYFKLAEKLDGLGHWYIDILANTLFWSDEVYRIHGVAKERFKPTIENAISFYHHADRTKVRTAVDAAINSAEPFAFDLRIVCNEGQIKHVHSKADCTVDEEGNTTAIYGIFRDITEEMKTQKALEQAKVVQQTFIEATGDGYWDWHIQDDYEYMSPRFWDMFGYMPEEKTHSPSAWQDMIFEEDLAVALDNFSKHIETKGLHPYEQEVRYRHKNGSTVTVLCRGKVIEWDRNGQPIRMIGTHTDITELKQKQEELERALHFQTLLMNVNSDLVFVKDEEFKIVTANPAFINLYPAEKHDEIIGFTTVEEYNEQQALEFLAEDKKALELGLSETIETIDFPDGKTRTLLTKKTRFTGLSGETFILGVGRDVSELTAMESKLRSVNAQLEEFAYRTSHDLRSPLISSNKLLSIIVDKLDSGDIDTAKQYMSVVKKSLVNLEGLVEDILQVTRLNNMGLEYEDINVNDEILLAHSKFDYMENFDRLALTITDKNNLTIRSVRYLLRVIVENLISNAIKYQNLSESSPILNINISVRDNKCMLVFEDNGIGVPDNGMDKLFTMFKRLHPQISTGSGLGLYMVKSAVQKLDGTVEYQRVSTNTGGSRFVICIPAHLKVN